MAELADLHAYDLNDSELTVWVYKRTTAGGVPTFRGRWVQSTPELAAALRQAVNDARAPITETIEYDILAQNNEGSALRIGADETYIGLVAAQAANPTPARKVRNLKQIANADFYVVRFASDAGVLMAVRKTDRSWSTRRTKGLMKVVYSDDALDIDERPSFNIDAFFDFFALGDSIFIASKPRFESVLSYRAGHAEAFGDLTGEEEFAAIFADLDPILEFVGNNKIHLRRAIAIREKAHYKDAAFMQNLRDHCAAMNLTIQFDANGRINPTPESCRDIFQALLDHRLDSRLSQQLYDVQHTEPVG